MNELYMTATGCSDILSISTNVSHGTNVSFATITAKNTTLSLGDSVTIDIGYTTNHAQIFTGYVKKITRQVRDDVYVISIYDVLVRAQDYFIASSVPSSPLKYQNILAETLVGNLMSLAGLTSFSPPPVSTGFTFGVNNPFEINLVSVMDYCRTICDLLTYSFWANSSGQVLMRNRKPFYVSSAMASAWSQPGLVADTPTGIVISDTDIIDISYSTDEQNLRNRVVVYGTGDAHGEASAASPYLPANFYKTALLAATGLLDTNAICQSVAEYNLNLLNKLTERISTTVVGNPQLEARSVIRVNSSSVGITGAEDYFYVYTCSHTIDKSGYLTQLELVR